MIWIGCVCVERRYCVGVGVCALALALGAWDVLGGKRGVRVHIQTILNGYNLFSSYAKIQDRDSIVWCIEVNEWMDE